MQNLVHYAYELGLLKRIRRAGWWVAGVDDPESVAEHTFRTAALGFLLAACEGADPVKTAAICLFHDVQETRIGDLHRLNRRYLDPAGAEAHAFRQQLENLPERIAGELIHLFEEMQDQETLEARVAKDADVLECLIQAREYQAQGCTSVEAWIQRSYSQLRTKAARRMAELCMKTDPSEWWQANGFG